MFADSVEQVCCLLSVLTGGVATLFSICQVVQYIDRAGRGVW